MGLYGRPHRHEVSVLSEGKRPALTKTTKRALARTCLCKGGGRVDEGMGPLRSPWGGVVAASLHVYVGLYGRPPSP